MQEFKYTVENYRSLSDHFRELLFSELYSDIVIQVDDSRIHAHRQVLAASSPVFAKMLYGDFAEGSSGEVALHDISLSTLQSLLEFIYTGTMEITVENLVALIEAADRYCLTSAKNDLYTAARSLIETADTSDSAIRQIVSILNDSHHLALPEFLEMCLEYVDVHTAEVVLSDVFVNIPVELMELVLQRDTLYDGLKEVQLYLACLRWARGYGGINSEDPADYETSSIESSRLALLKNLLTHVRFPLIPAQVIIRYIEPSGLVDKESLFKAVAFQAAPDCYASTNEAYYRERSGSSRPWTWSEELRGPHIILSSDYRTAIAHHYDWEKALGSVVWHAGKHAFSVILDMNVAASSNSWQIIIGVAHPETLISGHLGSKMKEWGLACFSGLKICNGDLREEYATASRKGDKITVVVDIKRRTLEYLKNDESLGVAYYNIQPPVCPAVSLLKGQRVTLVFD